VMLSGTHDGPMRTPMGEFAATHQKIGLAMVQHIATNEQGQVVREALLWDDTSLLGQLGIVPDSVPFRPINDKPVDKMVVIAKDSDTERNNVAAYNAAVETFNKHDLQALADAYDNDLMYASAPARKDDDKREMLVGIETFWVGFRDLKITPTTVWAAGDFVVGVGSMTGTNTGKIKGFAENTGKAIDLRYVEIAHFKDGKQDAVWLFYSSAALLTQLGKLDPSTLTGGVADATKPDPVADKPPTGGGDDFSTGIKECDELFARSMKCFEKMGVAGQQAIEAFRDSAKAYKDMASDEAMRAAAADACKQATEAAEQGWKAAGC
jgi:predicted ester cyclase